MDHLVPFTRVLIALVVIGTFSDDRGAEAKAVWIPRRTVSIAGGYGYSGSSYMKSFMQMQEDPRSIYRKHYRRGGVFDEPHGKGPWTHDKPVRPLDYKSEEWSPEVESAEVTTRKSASKSRKRVEVPAPVAGSLVDVGGLATETITVSPVETTDPPSTTPGYNGRVYRKSCGMRCGLG